MFIPKKVMMSQRTFAVPLGQGPFRYYQIDFYQWLSAGVVKNADEEDTTGHQVRLAEFELWTAGAVEWPTANMTSYTTPSPLVVIDDGDDTGAGFEQWRPFDGVNSDAGRWISGTANGRHRLHIDFGAGNAMAPASYRLCPDGAVSFGGTGYHNLGWELHGSNSGAFAGEEEIVDIKKWVGYHHWLGWANNTERTFNLNLTPTGAQHRYWRLKDITTSTNGLKIEGLDWFSDALGTPVSQVLQGGTWVTTLPSANWLSNLYDGSVTVPVWSKAIAEGSGFYFLLDMGEGYRQTIDGIKQRGGPDSLGFITGFTLQWSDNGIDWTTAFTKSGLTYPGSGVWSSMYTA